MPGKRRKGGIQSRGTTKKEEPEKEKMPARIVEQAGVPIDRVIGLSRKRFPDTRTVGVVTDGTKRTVENFSGKTDKMAENDGWHGN